jgi:AcrR family transcriptional regulator
MKEKGRAETQEWIIKALLNLMKEKQYHEITIVEIAFEAHIGRRTFYRYFKTKDEILQIYIKSIFLDFVNFIRDKKEITLYSVSLSYFEFCDKHIQFFKLLQKSHLLYFVGDRLPEFMTDVAIALEHVRPEQVDETNKKQDIYYYAHYFNMGGYWSITNLWISKEKRKSPKEMAEMIVKIVTREYSS